jgi:hypothetical protein
MNEKKERGRRGEIEKLCALRQFLQLVKLLFSNQRKAVSV